MLVAEGWHEHGRNGEANEVATAYEPNQHWIFASEVQLIRINPIHQIAGVAVIDPPQIRWQLAIADVLPPAWHPATILNTLISREDFEETEAIDYKSTGNIRWNNDQANEPLHLAEATTQPQSLFIADWSTPLADLLPTSPLSLVQVSAQIYQFQVVMVSRFDGLVIFGIVERHN